MKLTKDTGKLFLRVYNNKMIDKRDEQGKEIECDETMLCQLVDRVFGDGLEKGDPSLLNQFNNLIVQTADEVAFGQFQRILEMFAVFDRVPSRGDIKRYKIPKRVRSRFSWSATGSGVLMQRHENDEYILATPRFYQAGFSYDPNDLLTSTVENFRRLVNDIAEEKYKFLLRRFYAIVDASATSGAIPSALVAQGTNLSASAINGVLSAVTRIGGSRPIVVGDRAMIDKLGETIAKAFGTTFTGNNLPESVKERLFNDLNYTTLGKADAISIQNNYTDDALTKTELDVDKAFIMSNGIAQRPFAITDYGTMTQKTSQDFETDTVELVLGMSMSIMLLHGEAIGYFEDDAVTI